MIGDVLTVSEAADRLKISVHAVRKALHGGKKGLSGFKMGGRYYVWADSAAKYRPNRYPRRDKKR